MNCVLHGITEMYLFSYSIVSFSPCENAHFYFNFIYYFVKIAKFMLEKSDFWWYDTDRKQTTSHFRLSILSSHRMDKYEYFF